MSTQALEHFIAVAEAGSFTSAANRCHISQQGISKSVKSLEKELGVSLVERTGNTISLSEDGKELLVDIRKAVDAQRALITHARKIKERGKDDSITDIYVSSFVTQLMMPTLEELELDDALESTPVLEAEWLEAVRNVSKNRSAVAVVLYPPTKMTPSMKSRILIEDFFSVTAKIKLSKSLAPEGCTFLTSEDLKGIPFAYLSEPFMDDIVERLEASGFLKNVKSNTSSFSQLNRMVYKGRVATLSDTFCEAHDESRKDILYLPFPESITVNVGAIRAAETGANCPQARLIEKLRRIAMDQWGEYAKNHPPIP